MPAPATAQLWAERTPEGFVMNVKAFRLFTGHQTEPHVLHKDLQLAMGGSLPPRFFYRDLPRRADRRALEALPRDACCRCRPPAGSAWCTSSFRPGSWPAPPGRAQVEHCVQRMSGFDLGVEFRHGTWFEGAAQQRETLRLLRELGVAHTVVDGPQGFSNSVPAALGGDPSALRAASPARPQPRHLERQGPDLGLGPLQLRLCRRRAPGDGARRSSSLALTAMQTHVIFNNNMEDQGQRNATPSLTDLLVAAGVR